MNQYKKTFGHVVRGREMTVGHCRNFSHSSAGLETRARRGLRHALSVWLFFDSLTSLEAANFQLGYILGGIRLDYLWVYNSHNHTRRLVSWRTACWHNLLKTQVFTAQYTAKPILLLLISPENVPSDWREWGLACGRARPISWRHPKWLGVDKTSVRADMCVHS